MWIEKLAKEGLLLLSGGWDIDEFWNQLYNNWMGNWGDGDTQGMRGKLIENGNNVKNKDEEWGDEDEWEWMDMEDIAGKINI